MTTSVLCELVPYLCLVFLVPKNIEHLIIYTAESQFHQLISKHVFMPLISTLDIMPFPLNL